MEESVNIRSLEDALDIKKKTDVWVEEEPINLYFAERMQANFEGRTIELIARERYFIPQPWSDIPHPWSNRLEHIHEIEGAMAASTIPKEHWAKYLLDVALGFGVDAYKLQNKLFNLSIGSKDLSNLKERVRVCYCYKEMLALELGASGLPSEIIHAFPEFKKELIQSLPDFETFLKEWTALLNGGDAGKTTLHPELVKRVDRLASYAKGEAFKIAWHYDVGQRGREIYKGTELLSDHWIPLVWRGRHQDLLDEPNSPSGDKIYMYESLFKYLWENQPEPVELSLEMPGVGTVYLNSGRFELTRPNPVEEPMCSDTLHFYDVALKAKSLYRDANAVRRRGDNINKLLGIAEAVWSKYGGPVIKDE